MAANTSGASEVDYEELPSTPADQENHHSSPSQVYPAEKEQYQTDSQFGLLLLEGELAIDEGILPELSAQGSSGSYFVKNRQAVSHKHSCSCV